MATLWMADGTPIHAVDRGAGRPIVLLQGLQFTADYFWQRNLGGLAQSNRVVAVDHRSHGQSGKPLTGHSIAQCARDLKEVLDQLGLEQVTIGGVAFGAMVMLEYLRLFGPHRLAKLALIEAQVRLTNAPDWAHPTFGDFPVEAGEGFVAACKQSRDPLKGFITGAFSTPQPDSVIAEMQAQAWLTPTGAAIEYVEDMLTADYRADIAGLPLPTLFVYGRNNNNILATDLGRWLHGQCPKSTLLEYQASAHAPFWEEPERFNADLAAFANA
jgi:pimeloyl-ACP methyl ester carboxylesterase